ncbi:MAG: electron transfer flavoprotein subunit alpha/FixB family protein [Eubacterium sp.]|nr:electron transfer flavoprotein subunit alpha/FixB family protein [Eubacterium sp.]
MKGLIVFPCSEGQSLLQGQELYTAALELGMKDGDISGLGYDAKELSETALYKGVCDKAKDFDVIMLSSNETTRNTAALLAAGLGYALVNDVTGLKSVDEGIEVVRPVYTDSFFEELSIPAGKAVITIRPGFFEKSDESLVSGVEMMSVPAEPYVECGHSLTKIVSIADQIADAVDLEHADIIVAGGRGMGSKKGFDLCYEMADALGGAVGGTLSAVDLGYIDKSRQIGQSGRTVRPKLYFACGISGAPQHLTGMRDSGYIVAINKAPSEKIFGVSDVGIVGDALRIMPMLTEMLKKKKAEF